MGFLQLPKDIRAHILRKSGLRRACPIHIPGEGERHKRYHSPRPPHPQFNPFHRCSNAPDPIPYYTPFLETPCWHEQIPIQLLRICRQLYFESVEVLYGENSFVIEYSEIFTFHNLIQLGFGGLQLHSSFRYLRRLQICFGPLDFLLDHRWVPPQREVEITISESAKALHQLVILCRLLSIHTETQQLDLEIMFSFKKSKFFELEVLKILQVLPQLLHVSIWNQPQTRGHYLSAQTRRLAGKLLESNRFPDQTFPFEELPLELRRMILRQAVISDRPIAWEKCGYIPTIFDNAVDVPETNSVRCCRKCRRHFGQEVCCCSDFNFSSSCTCLSLRDGIFYVNHQIRHEALGIFFQHNEIVAHGNSDELGRNLRYFFNRESHWIWRVRRLRVDIFCNDPSHLYREYGDVVYALRKARDWGWDGEIMIPCGSRLLQLDSTLAVGHVAKTFGY